MKKSFGTIIIFVALILFGIFMLVYGGQLLGLVSRVLEGLWGW